MLRPTIADLVNLDADTAPMPGIMYHVGATYPDGTCAKFPAFACVHTNCGGGMAEFTWFVTGKADGDGGMIDGWP